MPPRPLIAVTAGDPAGVGPELCLRLLAAPPATASGAIPVVFGDAAVLARCAAATGLPAPPAALAAGEWAARRAAIDGPRVIDCGPVGDPGMRPGTVSAATGRASYGYLEAAIAAGLAGEVAALVTAPIHKEALRAAGVPFPGHTELLAARTGARRCCMMLTSDVITCSLATAHVGYRQVPGLLTIDRIREVIDLTFHAMSRLRGRPARLAVCGLNPHAGEHGLFGEGEEERIIGPAVAGARAAGLAVEGPLPPDTAFVDFVRERTDAYVCMYHDQGLIPFKALAFAGGVNVTLGLPIIRTSVGHGTALGIAWQGKANPESLGRAFTLAARLAAAAAAGAAG